MHIIKLKLIEDDSPIAKADKNFQQSFLIGKIMEALPKHKITNDVEKNGHRQITLEP